MESAQTENEFFEAAALTSQEGSTWVLKHDDLFGIFDNHGDINQSGVGEQGLYYKGTRHLSHFNLRIGGREPMLLNATVKSDNTVMRVELTTCDLRTDGGRRIARGTVHVLRSKLLWNRVEYDHFQITNHGLHSILLPVEFHLEMDGADIFEVRGYKRQERGKVKNTRPYKQELRMEYLGRDNRRRLTEARFSEPPSAIDLGALKIRFDLNLPPGSRKDLCVSVRCGTGERKERWLKYEAARNRRQAACAEYRRQTSSIHSSSERFNDLTTRADADLFMLNTRMPEGFYPYAGVPWFSAPFGRDGIITALQNIWRDTATARGVLAFLAHRQSTVDDPKRDAEPGKIIHEFREGEMAALEEIPFAAYYGSVDSTPLFLMLAGAYFRRTGDIEFMETLWPNIMAALEWIDRFGDRDGDGFVEYERRSGNGILQQGWKDADDTIFHDDGEAAPPPIALCEVQGYVYAAKREIADVAAALGREKLAGELRSQAARMKARFHASFWCDDLNTYALALDGSKRPCRVRSSNAGHALFTGIAEEKYAGRLVETLLSKDSFSGWGIRTINSSEIRYNPMAYHNGSIWPHDNSIIAMGMANYGFKREAMKVVAGIFEAGISFDFNRLPELFCGFERHEGQHPTLYPVACSPQAWSSGAVFHLIQVALGMRFSAVKPQVLFLQPMLPKNIHKLEIFNLSFAGGSVDLAVRRHLHDVGFNVTRKAGDVEVTVIV